jgi:leader peptidase (prepilin peptidase)/N-methyltransferase
LPIYIYIIFVFALGSCIGSFLNVVVWRLPRVELPEKGGLIRDFVLSFKALSNPPSHCPNCNTLLKWYDNLPVVGWIKLKGRCRFCNCRISVRYPIVELLTGLIFAGYFVAFYVYQVRNCCPQPLVTGYFYDDVGIQHEIANPRWVLHESWPIYILYMLTLAGLLAASLIDAELYLIPLEIPWIIAILGFIVHAFADHPAIPGSLNLLGSAGSPEAALAAGAAVGLAISAALLAAGWIPLSFAQGGPMMEVERQKIEEQNKHAKKTGKKPEPVVDQVEYTPWQIRKEISKEILFLLPPLVLGGAFLALTVYVPAVGTPWATLIASHDWLNGLLGSLLGALTGAFIIWITRILGTLGFGREAMGLGDVHLMFGIGAVLGAAGATITFFIAPFVGILYALFVLILRRWREIPYGPFLSMAAALTMLFYCPVIARMAPGMSGLGYILGDLLHRIGL